MKTTLILLAGLLLAVYAQAQTITHMDVYVQDSFSQNVQVTNGDTIITIEALKEPQMFVVLSDTNNITSFTVKIGTTNGGNDIIEKTFSFADEGTFQDGTSYTRDGLYVRFTLGRYVSLATYYANVRATVSGNTQDAISFNVQ